MPKHLSFISYTKWQGLLRWAALHILVLIIAVSGYGLLVTGLSLFSISAFQVKNPYIIGVTVFVFTLILQPLREYLQVQIDKVFSRRQDPYTGQLQDLSQTFTEATELPVITKLLRQSLENTLAPELSHIFTYDSLSGNYVANSGNSAANSQLTSDLRFSPDSALVQILSNRQATLALGVATTLPVSLLSEQAHLALLGAQLYIPMPGRKRLTGWLALGPRRSGESYTHQDISFLETLCTQAGMAIERSLVITDLERRVNEMNLLTRVSQGINITLALNDMFELVYAHTSQVFATRDLRITLRNTYSDSLYHIFYVENDERLIDRENHPLHISEGLEQEVVKLRRSIVTDDYARECRSRGVLPSAEEIYSWVGVPLNGGAETIGVLSLGSRNPAIIYNVERVDLLQTIADQTAAAIIKAGLLQEAERRTRQLTALNEVARSLTSNLELTPLLSQILSDAVEIINCEAGSLLLVENVTDELTYEVVIGQPGVSKLVGTRLPPGTGLVGKAVETRQPILLNEFLPDDLSKQKSLETGIVIRNMLIVPMQVKDYVIGVIEVINRKDNLPFIPDDQELLAAFSSQAAIAIENARLYTYTDKTLTERVEELSVMQRIDQELNASLDFSRAMRITLEWAMGLSHADAGFIGMMEAMGMRVMISQGYTTELDNYANGLITEDLAIVEQTIQNGQQYRFHIEEKGEQNTLLTDAMGQIVIPIRRESKVIGIILLERKQADLPTEETLDFLSRLSDHAAIAIANAQLYAEVQTANMAKSQIVSLVAHELKNPMTSIKGFTDLLSKGVVGPINEAQNNFLNTIRSNVDRMNTIVQDLNDLTKIEVGNLRLEFFTVPVKDIVDEVLSSFSQQIHDKQQKMIYTIPTDLPHVWADRTRLSQILTNLVSNAVKYTPAMGDITIGGELTRTASDDPSSLKIVHVWIQDTGIGIPFEEQEKIFQQYFRTEASKEMASGTGLGLNITKSLVEMQGGQIWFESQQGNGTTFHFTIPVAEVT